MANFNLRKHTAFEYYVQRKHQLARRNVHPYSVNTAYVKNVKLVYDVNYFLLLHAQIFNM